MQAIKNYIRTRIFIISMRKHLRLCVIKINYQTCNQIIARLLNQLLDDMLTLESLPSALVASLP